MALIKGSILGLLSGKFGSFTARIYNGETILAVRPSNFIISHSPAVTANRKKFSICTQLAKAVSGIEDLNQIWDKLRLPRTSVYNIVISKNIKYADIKRPTAQNIITPGGGFNLAVESAVIAADKITINLPALNGQANFSADEKVLSISMLLIGFDPVNAENDYFKIMSFGHTEADYNPANLLEVIVNLDQFHQNELARYNHRVLLISAAAKDVNGEIVQYSTTCGSES